MYFRQIICSNFLIYPHIRQKSANEKCKRPLDIVSKMKNYVEALSRLKITHATENVNMLSKIRTVPSDHYVKLIIKAEYVFQLNT